MDEAAGLDVLYIMRVLRIICVKIGTIRMDSLLAKNRLRPDQIDVRN